MLAPRGSLRRLPRVFKSERTIDYENEYNFVNLVYFYIFIFSIYSIKYIFLNFLFASLPNNFDFMSYAQAVSATETKLTESRDLPH